MNMRRLKTVTRSVLALALVVSCGRPVEAPTTSPRSETNYSPPDAKPASTADVGVRRQLDAATLDAAEVVRRRVLNLPLTDSLSSQVIVFDVGAGTKQTLCGDEIAKHAAGWTQYFNPLGQVPLVCREGQPGFVVCVITQQNSATTYARLALFFRVPEARLAGVFLDTPGTTDLVTLQSLMADLRRQMDQNTCP
jgi:hypothetical protein